MSRILVHGDTFREPILFRLDDGAPFDPANPRLKLLAPTGVVSTLQPLEKEAVGQYYAAWIIPSTAAVGIWRWWFEAEYTVDGDVVTYRSHLAGVEPRFEIHPKRDDEVATSKIDQWPRGGKVPLSVAFREDDGTLVDPTTPQVILTVKTYGKITLDLTKLAVGYYATTWTVPYEAPLGFVDYHFEGTYTLPDGGGTEMRRSPAKTIEIIDSGMRAAVRNLNQHAPGAKVLFPLILKDAEGALVALTSPVVSFFAPDGTTLTLAMVRQGDGQYSAVWDVPKHPALGFWHYFMAGTWTLNGSDVAFSSDLETFEVAEPGVYVDRASGGWYCSTGDVRGRFRNLPATLSDNRVQACIGDAQSEIDGRLRMKYNVPFSPAPEYIRNACIDLASANLLAEVYAGHGNADDLPMFKRWRQKGLDKITALLLPPEDRNSASLEGVTVRAESTPLIRLSNWDPTYPRTPVTRFDERGEAYVVEGYYGSLGNAEAVNALGLNPGWPL